MDTVRFLEKLGYSPLNSERVTEIVDQPLADLVNLLNRLIQYYYDWLDLAEQSDLLSGGYLAVDPGAADTPPEQAVTRLKQHLLYFPQFITPDPLAAYLKPLAMIASVFGGVPADQIDRDRLRAVLSQLAALAPACRTKDLVLVPTAFANDYVWVQEAARAEIDSLVASSRADEFYQPITAAFRKSKWGPGADEESARMTVRIVTEGVKLAGQLSAALDLTPVAGDQVVSAALEQELAFGATWPTAALKVRQIGRAATTYTVPGVKELPLTDLLDLRQNEKVFERFRRSVGDVLATAAAANPSDQRRFEAEFSQAADDLLRPQVDELNKSVKSSALEKFLLPAVASVGAGALAFAVTGDVKATSVTAAGFTPVSWVLDKLRKRYTKSGRDAITLAHAYGWLLPTD